MRSAPRSSALWRLAGGGAVAIAAGLALAAIGAQGGKPASAPAFDAPRGAHGVLDTDHMRRDHMEVLRHQRDDTVLRGKRAAQQGLRGCIECHAGERTRSVLGENGFCESCHRYAAVSIDCFECHNPRLAAENSGASK
jgi:hypothetical protein